MLIRHCYKLDPHPCNPLVALFFLLLGGRGSRRAALSPLHRFSVHGGVEVDVQAFDFDPLLAVVFDLDGGVGAAETERQVALGDFLAGGRIDGGGNAPSRKLLEY